MVCTSVHPVLINLVEICGFSSILLQYDYCNQGNLDNVIRSDCRKIAICCGYFLSQSTDHNKTIMMMMMIMIIIIMMMMF